MASLRSLVCRGCGETVVRRFRGKHDAFHYCSRACAFAHWKDSHPDETRHPLPRRTPKPPKPRPVRSDRTCEQCGAVYTPSPKGRLGGCCSSTCRWKAQSWQRWKSVLDFRCCPNCGRWSFKLQSKKQFKQFCSASCGKSFLRHGYPSLMHVPQGEVNYLADYLALIRKARRIMNGNEQAMMLDTSPVGQSDVCDVGRWHEI